MSAGLGDDTGHLRNQSPSSPRGAVGSVLQADGDQCRPTPSHSRPQGALAQTHVASTRADQHLTILDLETRDASHTVIFLTDLFQSLSAGPGRGWSPASARPTHILEKVNSNGVQGGTGRAGSANQVLRTPLPLPASAGKHRAQVPEGQEGTGATAPGCMVPAQPGSAWLRPECSFFCVREC